MTANESVIAQLAVLEKACAEMRKTLGLVELSVPKAKKGKKAESSDAEPKEKKAPNAWIVFSGRVEKLVRAHEESEGTAKERKMKTVVVKQFCSALKSKKAYEEWADEEVIEELSTWEPPAVSKQELEGKSKKSSAPASEAGSDAEGEKKKRKPQSEETKKAAAIKRAATKAANAAKAAATSEAEDEAEEEAEAPATAAVPAPKPAPKPEPKPEAKPAAKPAAKKTVVPKPAAKKVVDLLLDPWTHDGSDYLKNERGDVVSADGEWVGRWTGSEIDESVPEPSDFETLTSRD